ncbi:MAG: 30S ribosomal protein S19 [Candidatus Levybacteria bacterium]|nr:30S ribosomal protein S19 [Candidatus Levybacteria bacterium]
MARSAKKGPYIDQRLLKKITVQKQSGDRSPIKNGRAFINVFVQEGMVGHRLGEFSPTRTFRSHGRVVAREISKT